IFISLTSESSDGAKCKIQALRLANKKSRMFPEPNNEKAPGHAGVRWSARLSFWRYILVFDIVKSPKVTIQTKRIFMSEKNKPQDENKPQQPVAPKPTPTQSTTDFATRRVFVGDSADSVIEHIKKQPR
ncbi:TPA: hypothetical protein ACIYIS_004853, partial [Escherichia coli]